MHAMNGLTHKEVVTLKRLLEMEETTIRGAMHDEFARGANTNGSRVAQYHETTDDEAIIDVLNDASVATITRISDSLSAVDVCLKAIATDQYGVCESCGRHIGFKRLSVNPTAVRCTPCQATRERGQIHTRL